MSYTMPITTDEARRGKSAKERTISSMEVAEMVGKDHDKLLRDIRNYIEQLSLAKIGESDFFTESTYKNERGREYPCFLVTKKGCEFIAHKLTGIKGTEFTAKYINRFHEMEDTIQKSKTDLLQAGMYVVRFVADDLRVNEASRLLMYENMCKDFDIPTGFLPKYANNGSREMESLTVLLKENDCGISAPKFNIILVEQGYVEEKERASTKGDGVKRFKSLTDKGLRYGENLVSPHNQRETQPLYYSDTFMELFGEVM